MNFYFEQKPYALATYTLLTRFIQPSRYSGNNINPKLSEYVGEKENQRVDKFVAEIMKNKGKDFHYDEVQRYLNIFGSGLLSEIARCADIFKIGWLHKYERGLFNDSVNNLIERPGSYNLKGSLIVTEPVICTMFEKFCKSYVKVNDKSRLDPFITDIVNRITPTSSSEEIILGLYNGLTYVSLSYIMSLVEPDQLNIMCNNIDLDNSDFIKMFNRFENGSKLLQPKFLSMVAMLNQLYEFLSIGTQNKPSTNPINRLLFKIADIAYLTLTKLDSYRDLMKCRDFNKFSKDLIVLGPAICDTLFYGCGKLDDDDINTSLITNELLNKYDNDAKRYLYFMSYKRLSRDIGLSSIYDETDDDIGQPYYNLYKTYKGANIKTLHNCAEAILKNFKTNINPKTIDSLLRIAAIVASFRKRTDVSNYDKYLAFLTLTMIETELVDIMAFHGENKGLNLKINIPPKLTMNGLYMDPIDCDDRLYMDTFNEAYEEIQYMFVRYASFKYRVFYEKYKISETSLDESFWNSDYKNVIAYLKTISPTIDDAITNYMKGKLPYMFSVGFYKKEAISAYLDSYPADVEKGFNILQVLLEDSGIDKKDIFSDLKKPSINKFQSLYGIHLKLISKDKNDFKFGDALKLIDTVDNSTFIKIFGKY